MANPANLPGPAFHKQLHIKYWQRCLNHPLPHHYTSSDANRMTLAFFTLSALDLLDALPALLSPPTRAAYTDWIYACQHPDGGFRGFPGTDLGAHRTPANAVWDPANLPATYFALAALAVLRDDLRRVRRGPLLTWLRRLQRADGSFGETLGAQGAREGGRDPRFAYCAAAVRWMVAGEKGVDAEGEGQSEGQGNGGGDVDLEALVRCIRACETYDGGISDEPFHEPHAGYAYCSIAALSLINRLPKNDGDLHQSKSSSIRKQEPFVGLSSVSATTKWLLSLQTSSIEDNEDEDEDDAGEDAGDGNGAAPGSVFKKIRSVPISALIDSTPSSFLDCNAPWAGFSGRLNKIADTCYAFWVGGSLRILTTLSLIDIQRTRKYLLEKTQHPIMGGFSKFPGDPPDLYHAYMGLAALSLLNVEYDKLTGVAGSFGDGPALLDPELCFSVRTKDWIENLEWRKVLKNPPDDA